MRPPNSDTGGIVESSVHLLPEQGWQKKKKAYTKWLMAGSPIPEDSSEPREARATEMLALRYHERAFDILSCSSWVCRDRFCPKCGVERLRDHRAAVRRARRKMKRPVLMIFSVYTRVLSASALELGYDRLRDGIRRTLRCKSLRKVKIAIGRIEAVPTDLDGRLEYKIWHIHAHVIGDLGDGDDELDLDAVNVDFKRVTKRSNSFFGVEEFRSAKAVERYITKSRDVCPAPGTRTLTELDQLIRVLKGKELLVSWGVKHRGTSKRAKESIKPLKGKRITAKRFRPPRIEDSSAEYDRDDDEPEVDKVRRRGIRWIIKPKPKGKRWRIPPSK